MTGRIISGRQEPEPGSRRERAMTNVKGWLISHPTGGTYAQVAAALGYHPRRVSDAATDLHLFDPDLIVSVPAPKNQYTLRAGWSSILRQGEGNQARHAATRLERLSIRWRKIAVDRERHGDPIASTFRLAAANAENEARELRAVADVLG